MATHKSAVKEHQRSLKRRLRNRVHKGRMRTAIKQLRAAVAAGDAQKARELLSPTLSIVDRSARHGVIHDRTAARAKSRLTMAVNRLAV
jgi:small subunit ribosomal protein S20